MKQDLRKIILSMMLPLFLIFILYIIKILEVGMDWDFTRLGVYPMEKSFVLFVGGACVAFFSVLVFILLLPWHRSLYILYNLGGLRGHHIPHRKTRMAHRSKWYYLWAGIFSLL